jgi:hypothetical protein
MLPTAPLANGWTFGSAIRITTNTGSSNHPSVAASGSFVYVAWEDSTPVPGSGGSSEIWMRAKYGLSLGSPIRISTNTGNSGSPSVAANGTYVYVAWSDNTIVTGSYGSSEIWMRVSSNFGVSFGPAVRLSTNSGESLYPSVAAIGNYVYVAWEDSTPVPGSGNHPEIWMRVSSNYGTSFGSFIRITTNTSYSCEPSVAASGSYVYVAWDDGTSVTGSGGNPEIWMRVSANNGASFGSAIRITTNTGYSGSAAVAAAGSYVYVAWNDDTLVSGSNWTPEIWTRASSNYGASFGPAIRISSNAYNSYHSSVAASGKNICVAWDDETPVTGSGGSQEIWMRVSSNYGASFGSAIRISSNAYNSVYPSLAASGNYAYVTWEDTTPVTGSGGYIPEIWIRVGV